MKDDALARLDRESYVSLETRRRDGRRVQTPVWFAAHDGRLYVFTEGRAGKVKRLRNFPELRLAPCSVRGKVHGEWIAGTGRVVSDSLIVAAAYAALRRKYGLLMATADFFSRLTGRMAGRAILEIEV
ncbi:MAG: PPOX class F420-dependent oxidoreductase [Deltaproteobacteria bacterium]|nr:PPOX class F420-dependent oxidoreductase [Deltaproteobacteria bacterium]